MGQDGTDGQPSPGEGLGMGMGTLRPGKGGKAERSPHDISFSVQSPSLRSVPDFEEKQRALGGAGIYFI